MGTHPIFESDFDCLTEKSDKKKMSSGLSILAPSEADIRMMIAGKVHLGDPNADHRMSQYIHGVNQAQNHIFNLGKTWEKIMLAARAIAAVDNPADVAVISGKPQGQRAILKFATNTGATPVAGRYTPGAFTNQNQAAFREPRLLVVTIHALTTRQSLKPVMSIFQLLHCAILTHHQSLSILQSHAITRVSIQLD